MPLVELFEISKKGQKKYLFHSIKMKKITYQTLGHERLFKAIFTKILAIVLDDMC